MKDILYGWGLAMIVVAHMSEAWLSTFFLIIGAGLLLHSHFLANRYIDENYQRK